MKLWTLVLGPLENNCYILSDDRKNAVILDPALDADRIAEKLSEEGLRLCAVLLTHAHFDHIGALKDLCARFPVPVYLHPADLAIVPDMAHGRLTETTVPYPETLPVGDLLFRVLHTPGHSPGSVCLWVGDLLFTGDTLFCGSCGRTDFAGGDTEKMRTSLSRLRALDFSGTVLPGHGEATTLARERAENPFLR